MFHLYQNHLFAYITQNKQSKYKNLGLGQTIYWLNLEIECCRIDLIIYNVPIHSTTLNDLFAVTLLIFCLKMKTYKRLLATH